MEEVASAWKALFQRRVVMAAKHYHSVQERLLAVLEAVDADVQNGCRHQGPRAEATQRALEGASMEIALAVASMGAARHLALRGGALCPSAPLGSVDDLAGDPGVWCALEKLGNADGLATCVHDAIERARGHLRAAELLVVLDDDEDEAAADGASIAPWDKSPCLSELVSGAIEVAAALSSAMDLATETDDAREAAFGFISVFKEPSTTSGPIVPLKRTLQERVVETESCYFCGHGHTTIGNIDPDIIIFCNQCERPCHVKCYNNRVVIKKVPLEILKEYVSFRFLCCQECQSLRDRLEEGLEKCEEIAFLRRIRSSICWRFLNGMDVSRDVKLYMPQAIDIFKDAFVESTDEHSGIFSDMINCKNGDQEKDFRGMYCVLLTASTHVVSAAILKVRMEQMAELVLIATRKECRKKGYFILLLKSIEANFRACNVSLLTAPVDPEMAQIWSEKLGFTILSAEEESVLKSHPLVMFKNLVLVQKSLA